MKGKHDMPSLKKELRKKLVEVDGESTADFVFKCIFTTDSMKKMLGYVSSGKYTRREIREMAAVLGIEEGSWEGEIIEMDEN